MPFVVIYCVFCFYFFFYFLIYVSLKKKHDEETRPKENVRIKNNKKIKSGGFFLLPEALSFYLLFNVMTFGGKICVFIWHNMCKLLKESEREESSLKRVVTNKNA